MLRRIIGILGLVLISSFAQAQIVSHRVVGTRTFDIGPGQVDTFESVPWGALVAGDVVNIHYQPEPYKYKIGLRAQGTVDLPVIINGVTDGVGTRPVLDFEDAVTAPGSAPVFTDQPQFGESLAGVMIKRGPGDDYFTYKPQFIQIKNLTLRNTKGSYTTLAGDVVEYDVAACLYVLVARDVLFENLELTGCSFGAFFMAKDGLLSQAVERPTLRYNDIYDNGKVGSFFEHNVYMQADSPIVEYNRIGSVIEGSLGSSYKDRSAKLIFRHNLVDGRRSARTLDVVASEEQGIDGIITLPHYGTDFVQYNTLLIGSETGIHVGADNTGEYEGNSNTPFIPPVKYREILQFTGNKVIYYTEGWRNMVFDLSTNKTRVVAKNNIFVMNPEALNHHWVEWCGIVRLINNVVVGGPITRTGRDFYNPRMVRIIGE